MGPPPECNAEGTKYLAPCFVAFVSSEMGPPPGEMGPPPGPAGLKIPSFRELCSPCSRSLLDATLLRDLPEGSAVVDLLCKRDKGEYCGAKLFRSGFLGLDFDP